jgi:hypothetical protein
LTETVTDGWQVIEVGYAQPAGAPGSPGDLTAETTARIAGDDANASAIAGETTRAGNAETLLASQQEFTQAFDGAAVIAVNHNLGRYPAVTITDSAGDGIEGDVAYAGVNDLTITFSAPFSGTVYLT